MNEENDQTIFRSTSEYASDTCACKFGNLSRLIVGWLSVVFGSEWMFGASRDSMRA
jgi:hypothetical protein